MKKEKTIYDLKLHESISLNSNHLEIKRVAGGWLYIESYEYQDNMALTSCFIPFDNEFQKSEKLPY